MANQSRCVLPRTASTERNKGKIDDLIREKRRVKVREMAAELGMGQCAIHEMRSASPLVSALAGGEPRTSAEVHLLRTATKVCGRRRRPSSQHLDGRKKKKCFHNPDLETKRQHDTASHNIA